MQRLDLPRSRASLLILLLYLIAIVFQIICLLSKTILGIRDVCSTADIFNVGGSGVVVVYYYKWSTVDLLVVL